MSVIELENCIPMGLLSQFWIFSMEWVSLWNILKLVLEHVGFFTVVSKHQHGMDIPDVPSPQAIVCLMVDRNVPAFFMLGHSNPFNLSWKGSDTGFIFVVVLLGLSGLGGGKVMILQLITLTDSSVINVCHFQSLCSGICVSLQISFSGKLAHLSLPLRILTLLFKTGCSTHLGYHFVKKV